MPQAIPLPYSTGSYIVTQGFDTTPSHSTYLRWGVDFAMPYGTDVQAMISGEIVAFRQDVVETPILGPADSNNLAFAGSGHGNFVTVRSVVDGQDLFITYAHLAPNFLSDSLGIQESEGAYDPGTVWGSIDFGEVFAQTGATGLRGTSRPESDGAERGAHLHVHLGTDIVFFNTDAEWVADGNSNFTLPVYFDSFGENGSGVPTGPLEFGPAYEGSNYALFEDASDEGSGLARFELNGGTEFLVNDVGLGDQYEPVVAALADGGFVVVWNTTADRSNGNIDDEFRAKIFNSNGEVRIDEFVVDLDLGRDEITVTGLANGGFAIAAGGLTGKTYASDGEETSGNQFELESTPGFGSRDISLVGLSNGNFVASWGSLDPGTNIEARIFTENGVALGPEFILNSELVDEQWQVDLAAISGGRFVATWWTWDTAQDGSSAAVKARLFNADGSPASEEFLVNSEFENLQVSPAVTSLENGGFVISWVYQEGTLIGSVAAIKGQLFDANGTPLGDEFQINSSSLQTVSDVAITGTADGGFAVAWTGGSAELAFRQFSELGEPIGETQILNENTPGFQNSPSLTQLSNGDVVATWDTNNPSADGDGSAVKARIFSWEEVLPDVDAEWLAFVAQLQAAPFSSPELEAATIAFVADELYPLYEQSATARQLFQTIVQNDWNPVFEVSGGEGTEYTALLDFIAVRTDDAQKKFLMADGSYSTLSLPTIIFHELVHFVDDKQAGAGASGYPEIEQYLSEDVFGNISYGDIPYDDPTFDLLGSAVRLTNQVRSELDIPELARGAYNVRFNDEEAYFQALEPYIASVLYDQAVVFFADGNSNAFELFNSDGASASLDLVYGLNPLNDIRTGAGSDMVFGYFSDDRISTGSDNDRAMGLGGNDVIDGGDGIDTAIYRFAIEEYSFYLDASGTVVIEHFASSTEPELNDGRDELTQVEFAEFANGEILELAAVRTIDLQASDAATIRYTPEEFNGVEVLYFNPIDALQFSNTIFDERSLTVSSGSAILDIDFDLDGTVDSTVTLQGDFNINNFIVEGSGEDTEIRYLGDNPTLGDDESNNIIGGGADDQLYGRGGSDALNGGTGDDLLFGESGNDILIDAFGTDRLDGGEDNDLISAFSGENTLLGDDGNDLLTGGIGADSLSGGAGNDILIGDISNFLFGNDRLAGGLDDDLLQGGGGADVFVFNRNGGTDVIARIDVDYDTPSNSVIAGADYQIGLDRVDVSSFGYLSADEAYANVSDIDGHATFNDGGTTIVFFDVLTTQLSADDFLFV